MNRLRIKIFGRSRKQDNQFFTFSPPFTHITFCWKKNLLKFCYVRVNGVSHQRHHCISTSFQMLRCSAISKSCLSVTFWKTMIIQHVFFENLTYKANPFSLLLTLSFEKYPFWLWMETKERANNNIILLDSKTNDTGISKIAISIESL